MEKKLCEAINKRNLISFDYEGESIITEPFTLGIHKDSGDMILSAYIIGGTSDEKVPLWNLFSVNKIENLAIADGGAESQRENNNENHGEVAKIICTI